MSYRSPARYLAPLALGLAFIAVLMVLASGDDKGSGTTTGSRPTTTTSTTTVKARAKQQRKQPTTYTVQPGDVLSAIAEKTGVPLERLLELNEDLDPQVLRAGQKLRLRR